VGIQGLGGQVVFFCQKSTYSRADLDELRESGETNMFGAPSFLVATFGLSRKEAMEVTYAWMKTFDATKSMDERVELAEAARPS
jgi:hypothetical protein